MIKKFIKYLEEKGLSKNTIESYKSSLKILKIQNGKINEVIKKILSYKKNANTIRMHKNVALNYYDFHKNQDNWLKIKNIKMPPMQTVYQKVFTKSYILKKTEINPNDKSKERYYKWIFRFLFETGIRAKELSNIIEIKKETLIIIGKGNKKREIFYKEKTLNKIISFDKNIFSLTNKTLRIWIKKIMDENSSLHTLRRSFATHMLNAGAMPQFVMIQMGHKDINTTYKYVNNSYSQNKKIYNKFF